jgi:hypothetical protein
LAAANLDQLAGRRLSVFLQSWVIELSNLGALTEVLLTFDLQIKLAWLVEQH